MVDLANYVHLVAFADVDFTPGSRAAPTVQHFPEVQRFTDYRVMVEKRGREFDAVTLSMPDHPRFPAAMLAMAHVTHVFVPKPLTNKIRECRPMLLAPERRTGSPQWGFRDTRSKGNAC